MVSASENEPRVSADVWEKRARQAKKALKRLVDAMTDSMITTSNPFIWTAYESAKRIALTSWRDV